VESGQYVPGLRFAAFGRLAITVKPKNKRCEMNIPGFDAESSLGPTMGIYRGKAVFGRLGAVEISPAQEFLASSARNRNLDLLSLGSIVLKREFCCFRQGVGWSCENSLFKDCVCLGGFPKCTPWVFF
jgi:hypothetical protein